MSHPQPSVLRSTFTGQQVSTHVGQLGRLGKETTGSVPTSRSRLGTPAFYLPDWLSAASARPFLSHTRQRRYVPHTGKKTGRKTLWSRLRSRSSRSWKGRSESFSAGLQGSPHSYPRLESPPPSTGGARLIAAGLGSAWDTTPLPPFSGRSPTPDTPQAAHVGPRHNRAARRLADDDRSPP